MAFIGLSMNLAIAGREIVLLLNQELQCLKNAVSTNQMMYTNI